MYRLKYKPSRDIPKAVRQLRSTSRVKIVEWIKQHRTERDPKTGRKVQQKVTPQSISAYFKRHPDLEPKLRRELRIEELPKGEITDAIFENGVFDEISSIKRWTLKMGAKAKPQSVQNFKQLIKKICQGIIRYGSKKHPERLEVIEGWGLKHPDALTTRDALEYIAELKKRKYYTRQTRLALRNFLKANNREDWDDIGGETEGAGKYSHLYINKETVYRIFEELKALNYDAYLSVKFSFKCGGARINATLNAHGKDFVEAKLPDGTIERTIWLWEKASLHKETRKVEKLIPDDYFEEIKDRLINKQKLFNITQPEICGLLRAVYEQVIPELNKEIKMPFQFWRHLFAQHSLRATGWNYGLVAGWGDWTVQTLEKYYGKMDRKVRMEQGRKILPTL